MSIANELSSDVAIAVLARRDVSVDANANALQQVVLSLHHTLQHLKREAREARRKSVAAQPWIKSSSTFNGY